LVKGLGTFWPAEIVRIETADGSEYLGEIARSERVLPELQESPDEEARRILVRTGNYDIYGDDFKWIEDDRIVSTAYPEDAYVLERMEWGRFYGFIDQLVAGDESYAPDSPGFPEHLGQALEAAEARREEINRIEKNLLGKVNEKLDAQRLAVREAELKFGEDSKEYRQARAEAETKTGELQGRHRQLTVQIRELREKDEESYLTLSEVGGKTKSLLVSDVVRMYPANQLSFFGKIGVYVSRWGEFLGDEPREANTEGGVLPAIFGTVAMTLIMCVFVAPFGVLAALYLREYAKQGAVISAIRISVNNLAGVPSIVFGVFGLGLFCYTVGGTIDSVFFQEKLPNPTYGTGGLLWASLTLALLTVPVVIVSTEEALAAVPRSMREGSYACGASRWQTIKRIVLPRATPGIMTGLILAMARGAGEVAPLMLTGVAKMAPELPVDSSFPFLHPERSFMHLGFHIYDVGFQSRNAEAAKPMVFATALLLIAIVLLLNISAIHIRNRLKRKYVGSQF
jgi:phosphate transport system permease protein